MQKPIGYDSVGRWGSVLHRHFCNGASARVVELLHEFDCTTVSGLLDLSSAGIRALQNNSDLTPQEAVDIIQYSQELKKFRYGCTADPDEMLDSWIARNELTATQLCDSWVVAEMRRLLAPLGAAFEAADANGRFGNGAVFDHKTPFARWNAIDTFSYNVRRPDDLRWWNPSPWDTARLSCVPKDMGKLRVISVEPSEGTFLQQLYRTRLIAAAARVIPASSGIPDQVWGGGPERQRARCVAGSRDGSLATIDLSNASDCISWRLVQAVFPTNIVACLERARSAYMDIRGEKHEVYMYAGMGNATTFIVESLVFWALFTTLARWLRDFVPVSVFGDDIVMSVKSATHPLLKDYVARHGFELNEAKCGLSRGPGFREACGVYAYNGHSLPLQRIRGYSWENPEEAVAMCSLLSDTINSQRYAPFFTSAACEIAGSLVAETHLPILPEYPVTSGLYLVDKEEKIGAWSYRARWDPRLQHPEVRVKTLVPQSCRTLVTNHVTNGEALGILNGQVHTSFQGAAAGYSGRRTVFRFPSAAMCLKHTWVPVWATDSILVELGSQG